MAISAMKTAGDYRFDEVFSAMQKCVRSGDEVGCLYWAIELEPSFTPHLWNRLEIISHEDIGLANPELIVFIRTCKLQYLEMKKRNSSATRLVLANAIMALCRSPKSRMADTFCNSVYRASWRLDIPDIAKDKHTAAGRRMGRGWAHFFQYGIVCANDTDVDDPYRADAERLMSAGAPFKYDPKARARSENAEGQKDTGQLAFE